MTENKEDLEKNINVPEEEKQDEFLTTAQKLAKQNKLIETDTSIDDFEAILQKKMKQPLNQPKEVEKKTGLQIFATILLVIGTIAAVYSLLIAASFILMIAFYLILVVVIILTLFTILFNEGFNKLLASGNQIVEFFYKLFPTLPYSYGIALGFCLLSFVLFAFSKKGHNRKTGMIASGIISLFVIVGGVVGIIFLYRVKAANP